jgi:pimeloyl-ACP methyl ester carboxylesterase
MAVALAALATPSTAAEEATFDSKGTTIRYIVAGTGEPVILIHGYTSSTERQFVTTGVFDALAKKYRVYGMDARGHGKSGKPHDPAAYGPEMGLDIVRLMDHLKLKTAHVVGYSMGAHIVAQLLTLHPERFATATLGGATGRRNWSADDQKRVDIESAEMDEGMLRSQILRLWPKDQPPPSDEDVRKRSAESLAGLDNKALAAVRRSNPAQVYRLEDLAKVKVPVLGIVGTADPYLKDFQQLKAGMPQLELVTIEGASHNTAPGRPEFVAALMKYLAAHPIH